MGAQPRKAIIILGRLNAVAQPVTFMRILRDALALPLLAVAATASAAQAPRPARIEIELVADHQTQATASQPWFELLTELKVDALRVRANSADSPEKPVITPTGRKEARRSTRS